ncbi:hypothetical protein TrLO_g11569 [Triparma laevis f. longispina]|uniref:Uncharacterized protein n=1 Tax=Triparma laevis f. longispina TaxID=1714387 RepID=A0A9W7CL43_9STRA|nr:hypothetical protein TrLO_g11569 [Triparma laevis f. longispina]
MSQGMGRGRSDGKPAWMTEAPRAPEGKPVKRDPLPPPASAGRDERPAQSRDRDGAGKREEGRAEREPRYSRCDEDCRASSGSRGERERDHRHERRRESDERKSGSERGRGDDPTNRSRGEYGKSSDRDWATIYSSRPDRDSKDNSGDCRREGGREEERDRKKWSERGERIEPESEPQQNKKKRRDSDRDRENAQNPPIA